MQKTLPKGWKWVRLGDEKASQIIMGQSPPSFAYNTEGFGLPFYQGKAEFGEHHPKTVKWCSQPVKIAETDDILISVRAPVGDVNICEEKSCIGRGLAAIRINKTSLNNKFLYYFFKRDTSIWNKLSTGSTFDSITGKTLQSFSIPLPPLPTQNKIVEILEEADNLRKLRKQADEKMKGLIPSLFVQMFGDPAMNPKRWKIVELYEAATFKRGPFGGSLKKEIFINSGYKVYEQRNAIYNDFTIGSYYIDEEKYKAMLPFAIQPDDLIVSCSGTMGKVAIVPQNAQKGIINQALLKITPKKHMTASLYLKFLIESNSIQSTYFKNAAGSAIQNVTSVLALKKIKIPLPPLPLQQEFAKLVDNIEAEKARQAESRKKVDELFNSLMQRAFIGELVA